MANPSDLILGVLFKAKPDPQFSQITRRLQTILTSFSQGMDRADQSAKRLDQTMSKLKKSTEAAGRGMKDTKEVTEGTGKQIGKITKGIDRLISAFKVVAVYTVAGRVFQGFQSAVREGVREIIEFDQALANLKAITGATDQEIMAMRDTLKDTALRTKFSTTEVAEGMVLLGQAGLSGAESIQAIDAVSDLAAGTLSDFRDVSDLVTTTLRAFNLEATETRRVADVMASAVNKSKLTIDKLRTAFNYVGAGAAQAGLSLETTAATMMVLANNGLRASTIGTGLRQVLSRLLAPNAKLREAMSRYGLELDKATGKSDWFENQLGKLSTVMYNFKDGTVDMAKAYTLFGLRGAQAAAILVNAYNDLDGTWEVMLEQARTVGTSNEMMMRQAEGLGFKVKNLSDSFGVLAINLGEAGLTSALRFSVDLLRDFVKVMGSGVKLTVGRSISTFIGLSGALYSVLLVVKAIIKALMASDKLLLKGLKSFFFGPWGWVILVLSGVAAAFTALYSASVQVREELVKQANEAKIISTTLENYKKQLDKVKEGSLEYESLVGRLKQALPDYADQIDGVSDSYEELSKFIDKVNEQQKQLTIEATGKTFLIDMQRINAAQIGSGDVITDSIEDLIAKGVPKDDPRIVKLVSDFVQFIFATYAREMKAGMSRTKAEDTIVNLFAPEGAYNKIYTQFPKVVSDILERLDTLFGEHSERQKKRTEDRLARERAVVASLSKEYQDFIDLLYNTKQYLTLLEFLDKVRESSESWQKRKEDWEATDQKNFKTQKARDEALAILKKQHEDDVLKTFMDNEKKKMRMLEDGADSFKKTMAKIRGDTVGEFEAGYEKLNAEVEKLRGQAKEHRDKGQISEEEYRDALIDLWIYYYTRIQKLANKYGVPPHLQSKIPTISRAPREDWKGMPRGLSADKREKKEESDRKALERAEKESFKTLAKLKEEAYRRGEIDAEEYFAILDGMREREVISVEEWEERKRRETQGTWANFKEGWKKTLGEAKTLGEFFFELGKGLADQLSSNFGSAFADFVMGAKSAKEAFTDFARSTLRWIAEIAAKKAAMGFLLMLGVGASSYQPGTGSGGGPSFNAMETHKGGMYGEGTPRRLDLADLLPKFHGGLMPNEFAAILRKDEGVFTKEQMKALGGGGVTLQTEINVNVSSQGGKDAENMREMGNIISQTVKTEFQLFLRDELRPGGILNRRHT